MRLPISLPLNYMRIFCRFRDITIFENLRFFAIFTDSLVRSRRKGVPLGPMVRKFA